MVHLVIPRWLNFVPYFCYSSLISVISPALLVARMSFCIENYETHSLNQINSSYAAKPYDTFNLMWFPHFSRRI
jgi:hypothetical protein